MTREKAKEIISYHKILVDRDKSGLLDKQLEYQAIDMAIKALEQEPKISLDTYKQVTKERDIAIEQLHELGYEFGEKIEPTTKNDLVVDCISKQAVIDIVMDMYGLGRADVLADTLTKIDNLPSVTPQEPRWIPVSEKLPNDRDWYLGIFKEADTGWINPLPFICTYMGTETMATTKEYWILRGFSDRIERTDYYFNLECVAWMPLPQPYKAEGEDKE